MCNLASRIVDNIVTVGQVFDTILDDMLIHFISYGSSYLHVSIDTVLVLDILLPCPIGEYMYAGQSVGVFPYLGYLS